MLRISLQITIIFIVLLISGCSQIGTLKLTRIFKSAIGQSESARIADIKSETDRLLVENKATEALAIIEKAINSGIPEEKLAHPYIFTLNSLITLADRTFAEQNLVNAGSSYRLALNNYPTHSALKKQINKDQNSIRQQLNNCADQLLDTGLTAYRNGELQAAINTWSQIRQFHPSYKASQQAIRTARTQLKNLKTIENNPG